MNNNNSLMLGACSEQCNKHANRNAPILSYPYQVTNHCDLSALTIKNQPSEKTNIELALMMGNVEIRAIQKTDLRPVVWSGIFDDYNSISRSARYAEKSGFDVYMGLNPNNLTVTNDIKPFRRTVKDTNVTHITRIFFDLDPVRETGTPATEHMLEETELRLERLIKLLPWGEPLIGFSGNGYHAQYFCSLPNNDDIAKLLSGLYSGLQLRIDTAEVSFDVTVKNASRITRFYGTTNRKSDRRSRCTIPKDIKVLPSDLIIKTAQELTPPKPMPNPARKGKEENRGKFVRNLDVLNLFSKHGLYLETTREPGKHWVTCPWSDEHTDTNNTDTVVWEGEWPQFHCSHNHCANRSIADVIGVLL